MNRPLTNSKSFVSLTTEEQQDKVMFLREKRHGLRIQKKKAQRPVKLPVVPFVSQEHKLCYLGLPKVYQKLFL